jgi:anaerobic selenocysteine-containing dehydrogenase
VAQAELERLADIFAGSPRAVALPGGMPLGQPHGLAAAQAILALNVLADNLGQEGGTFFVPETSLTQTAQAPNPTADLLAAIERMNRGQVRALFIHGVNPAYELPVSAGFAQAVAKVPLVISFASFLDETALLADYVLPDHTPLESWGYQRVATGSDRAVLSALQPVVVPVVNTRATADVLLAAAQSAGGSLAGAVPFSDVADYLQQTLRALPELSGSLAGDLWTTWLQHGGWWPARPGLDTPQAGGLDDLAVAGEGAAALGEGELYLLPFPHPNLGDGSGANRPWLQETPDPMTTVMWNSWVEINPATARALGVKNDEVVKITSAAGSIEAVVYEYPAIHPQVIAIPLGQGHTALGRYAQGRGANPLALLETAQNEAGSLAFMATKVKVQSTGRRKILARYESREGVYGSLGEAG